MKVMCVRPFTMVAEYCKNAPRPAVGDIDEVVQVVQQNGHDYYLLERFGNYIYKTCMFAPLSDIDETELVNERETVNV